MEVLQRAIGEPLTKKLDVGKALDKLRGSDEPKTRMTLLDEKNKALDEEIRRLRAETTPRAGQPRNPPAGLRNPLKRYRTWPNRFTPAEAINSVETRQQRRARRR